MRDLIQTFLQDQQYPDPKMRKRGHEKITSQDPSEHRHKNIQQNISNHYIQDHKDHTPSLRGICYKGARMDQYLHMNQYDAPH